MQVQDDFKSRFEAISAELRGLKESCKSETEKMFSALYPVIAEMEGQRCSKASILAVLKKHNLEISLYRYGKLKAAEQKQQAETVNRPSLKTSN